MILKHRFRLTAAALLLAAFMVFSIACDSKDDDSDPGVGAVVTVIATPGTNISSVGEQATETAVPVGQATSPAGPTATVPAGATAPAATSTSVSQAEDYLSGYEWPIAGGCLPQGDQLMPGAPRTYRNGIHEGVDFYDVDNCAFVYDGMPVMAARDGVVIRADTDYVDPTPAQMQAYLADPNSDHSFDQFRGRQVWVRHDDGGIYVTRYCHLSGVAPGIVPGTRVTAGQVIAYVGESGTPESLTNPGSEIHLHFEMRIGNSYLGAGQSPAQVRALYQTLFSQ